MKLTRCDLALALAPFRRRPGLAAVMVILIAVACALTTVNFSTFLFLHARPLPYSNYDRVLWIGQAGKLQKQPAGDQQTLDNFTLLQDGINGVERVTAFHRWHNETLRHEGLTETVTGCWITPGFFEVLGVKPVLGSTFSDPAAVAQIPRPLLLSTRLWERRFARDPGVLRRTVWLNDRPHVVVGVMGEAMPGYGADEQPEYWAPLNPEDIPKAEWKSRWFPTLALRRADASLAQVQAGLDVATQRLRELHPTLMAERRLVAHDLKLWLFGANRGYFNLLMIVAALLSALVVANLVNLLLGQLADRTPYFATARALGAHGLQLLKPLLIEHLLLCALGLVAAVPLALAYRHLLVATLGPAGLTLPAFEGGVFAATGLAAVALVFLTLLLGVRTLQGGLGGDATRSVSTRVVGSRSRGWIDGVAILAQTGIAIALLVACSLLALSLLRQASANADLPLVGLQRAFLVLRRELYPSQAALVRRALEIKSALLAAPEIGSASIASDSVAIDPNIYAMIDDLDTVPIRDSPKQVVRASVCPDYFATVGLRIVAGRNFTEADLRNRQRYMVISQRVAELYFPGRDPLGRRMLVNHRTDDWAEIVGVAQNLESPVTNAPLPLVWRSLNHHPFNGAELYLQTRAGRPLARERFQKLVWGVDPDVLIVDYGTVAASLKRQRWLPEAIAQLSLLLAIVACGICAFGVFSVLNRRVAASLKEIAVRKALGASAWHVVASVGRRDLGWAVGGIALGVGLSLLGGRHVFEVSNLRIAEVVLAPVVGAAAVFGAAALGALVPIARALTADTVPLLRGE